MRVCVCISDALVFQYHTIDLMDEECYMRVELWLGIHEKHPFPQTLQDGEPNFYKCYSCCHCTGRRIMKAIKTQCIDFPYPSILLRLTGSEFHLLLPFHLLLTVSCNCFKHSQSLPSEHTFCAGTAELHRNLDHGQ